MLRFFSKIRFKLAAENRPVKYARYAFGEILLVVIGILIALQVNNWNEQRKANKLEAEYYCRLVEDLIQDGEQIDALIIMAENRLKASNQALRLLQKEKANQIEVATQIALAIKAIYTDFQPNNSAFEDLKSGSNLKVIKDKNVIKALNTYFNNIESLMSVIKINGQNAVDIHYAHDNDIANGKTAASILNGRFKQGMEPDVRDAVKIDTSATLAESMQQRLYNEALRFTSANTRQLELYSTIRQFNTSVTSILQQKCKKTDD